MATTPVPTSLPWSSLPPTTLVPTTPPPLELEFESEIVTEVTARGDICW